MKPKVMLAVLLGVSIFSFKPVLADELHQPLTQTQQEAITPAAAVDRLVAGNLRFLNHQPLEANYAEIIESSKKGQHPAAMVLACIDSRVPPEIIFDQSIGSIFVSRVAASVLSEDVLAGMEYATHVAGAKAIVVLGHEDCGAVKAACKGIKLGHITQLLEKISVARAHQQMPTASCAEAEYVDLIAKNNVMEVVKQIPEQSSILRQEIADGQLVVVGAMYHVSNGQVEFLN